MACSQEYIIASGKYLRLVSKKNWEYTKRLGCSGAVIIAAVTENQELILVEQYRVPVSSFTIELPAGLVGDSNNPEEDVFVAAKRELLEETGYEAYNFELIISGPSSSGITSEIHTLIYADSLKKLSTGGGIGDERISIHLVPLASVYPWLKKQYTNAKLVDPKILAALFYIQQR